MQERITYACRRCLREFHPIDGQARQPSGLRRRAALLKKEETDTNERSNGTAGNGNGYYFNGGDTVVTLHRGDPARIAPEGGTPPRKEVIPHD